MKRIHMSLLAAVAITAAAYANHNPELGKVLVNKDRNGVALQGHDPVAYFTENKPVKGSEKLQSRHEGATYQFVSVANKAAFEADPAKYAPSYGGYCGYAASINRLSPISPEWFQILDGRLVLQHNKRAWDKWNVELSANLEKADRNWPGLVEKNGTGGKTLVNVDRGGAAIRGHDPVAYFTEGRAVKGDSRIEAAYNGALYHFISQENREQFERDPARYAPAYGGYCAYAASINKVSDINPDIFQIEDGRLMLQHTQKAYDLFNKDTPSSIRNADRFWPGLVEKKGK